MHYGASNFVANQNSLLFFSFDQLDLSRLVDRVFQRRCESISVYLSFIEFIDEHCEVIIEPSILNQSEELVQLAVERSSRDCKGFLW